MVQLPWAFLSAANHLKRRSAAFLRSVCSQPRDAGGVGLTQAVACCFDQGVTPGRTWDMASTPMAVATAVAMNMDE